MKKPNLLFIYTDEQAFNTLACYGNSQIIMPNINRFAEKSTVFEHAYVTQSVCTPSRSSLLTGQWPHTNGCTENNLSLRDDTKCLPEMISGDDYKTAHYGKWHLGDEIWAQHGFNDWRAIDDAYSEYASPKRDKNERSSYHHFLVEKGFEPNISNNKFTRTEASKVPEEYSKPAYLAQEARKFLIENCDNPFILYVNFFEPHMPFTGPRNEQYNPKDMPLPKNFEKLDKSTHLKAQICAEHYKRVGHTGFSLDNLEGWQHLIARYWGLCSQVDTHCGMILDTLEELGLDENTIVVYTSDHGDMMGSHQLIAKTVQFEEAVRVPFMVRMPGQKEGRKVGGIFSQIDIVPTLLELMGQNPPEYLQGQSRANILKNSDITNLNEDIFIEWNGPNNGLSADTLGKVHIADWMMELATEEEIQRANLDPVRTIITSDGWKFTWSTVNYNELYNLKDDPYELNNVYVENPQIVNELKAKIRAWQKRTNDSVIFP